MITRKHLRLFGKEKTDDLKRLKKKLIKKLYIPEDQEVWLAIEDAPMYEVSNYGRVRSWRKRGKGKGKAEEPTILSQSKKNTGEIVVNIIFRGKYKSIQVKRLVYDTFAPGYRHPNTIIVHKDGKKHNNHFDNLILAREYVDLPDKDILAIRVEYDNGATKRFLSKKFNVSLDNLVDIIHGDKGGWVGGPIEERDYKRKLTPEEIHAIKEKAKSGKETEAEIGKAFGIREQRVSRILNSNSNKKHKSKFRKKG